MTPWAALGPTLTAICLVLAGGAAPPAVSAGRAATAEEEIVIETSRIVPAVLKTTIERRVSFVNRSGQMVHVDFVGRSDEHHVFQVPGRIWAIFHRPGRHAYVVHFYGGRHGDLRGAVEAADDPGLRPSAPICGGVTVMETCIEP